MIKTYYMNISELIRNRRSVFPVSYNDKEIPKAILEEILENANWAPTHRKTEPWRFKVMRKDALSRLSQFLANFYKENTPSERFSPKKYEKTLKKPLQSSCVIAICMQRDTKESIPEWEEIAAVSCAVQNMWLTCTYHQIGCYWSSPKAIEHANELFEMNEGEKCLGFFFMGYYEPQEFVSSRTPISEKVLWLEH